MTSDLIEVVKTFDHPQDRLWAVMSNPELYPRFVREISWCAPTKSGPPGAGSHYDVRFSVGGGPVSRNDVEILSYRAQKQLVLVSRQWPGGHMMVRLDPLGPARTELRLTILLPRLQRPTVVTAKWLRKRARTAVQLVNDHLSGVPVPMPSPRPSAHRRTHRAPTSQQQVRVAHVLTQAGVLSPRRPVVLLRQLAALARRDGTVLGGYRASIARAPHHEAITDEVSAATFAEVDDRTNRLANALTVYGVRPGTYVALLCRNHAALVESVIACGKLGAHALLLDTNLSSAQMTDAIRRYRPALMFLDDEFVPLARSLPRALPRIRTGCIGTLTVEQLVRRWSAKRVKAPRTSGRIVVLTSGMPSNPHGPRRRDPHTLRAIASVLSRVPLREGERMLVTAPLFHSWAGPAAMQLAMPLHAKLVLQRQFDAERTLRLIETHRCTSLFTEPHALRQIMDLPPHVRRRYDTSSLRVLASCGPPMPPRLVTAVMNEFGDVLYNLYGSAKVSWASIADPKQLRSAPTTAGRPPVGTRVEILDSWGRPVPPGVAGKIHVGDDMFDGYPGRPANDPKDLLPTGDRGYVDADNRLFVVSRESLVAPLKEHGPKPARTDAPVEDRVRTEENVR